MKKTIIIFIIIFFNSLALGETISGKAFVVDGDTIKINSKKIRLFGIDAPEKKQKCKKIFLSISFFSLNKSYNCGILSTEKLKKKIKDNIITCKIKGKDRYKRIIAECFKDKTNLNSWLVRNGYAVAYIKYSKKYLAAQNLAEKENRGIWQGIFEMPWDWRKKNKL
jgi:endonuclease YncB( thermonuclease family)